MLGIEKISKNNACNAQVVGHGKWRGAPPELLSGLGEPQQRGGRGGRQAGRGERIIFAVLVADLRWSKSCSIYPCFLCVFHADVLENAEGSQLGSSTLSYMLYFPIGDVLDAVWGPEV